MSVHNLERRLFDRVFIKVIPFQSAIIWHHLQGINIFERSIFCFLNKWSSTNNFSGWHLHPANGREKIGATEFRRRHYVVGNYFKSRQKGTYKRLDAMLVWSIKLCRRHNQFRHAIDGNTQKYKTWIEFRQKQRPIKTSFLSHNFFNAAAANRLQSAFSLSLKLVFRFALALLAQCLLWMRSY